MVMNFLNDVYYLADEYPELEATSYCETLEKNNISLTIDELKTIDVSSYDEKTVFALLIFAVRADRFCDGFLLECFQNGTISKLLSRLASRQEQ